MSKAAAHAAKSIRPRLRVTLGADIALGPGKVELLELVAETGSIAKAATQMEMSYMRAWLLIKTMERCFRKPLVEAVRGGSERGGTRLSPTGAKVVVLYRQMDAACLRATNEHWHELRRLLSG